MTIEHLWKINKSSIGLVSWLFMNMSLFKKYELKLNSKSKKPISNDHRIKFEAPKQFDLVSSVPPANAFFLLPKH